MPRTLNSGELKERSRQVKKAARLTMELQARGYKKREIKIELRKKYRHQVIREAFTGVDTIWPVDGCKDFLQREFNGRTRPGRMVIAAGLKQGYNRKTVYRALLRTGARLRMNGKNSTWKFDWITERRPFLDEVQGHVGENKEINARSKTPASKRKIDERGQARAHSSDRAAPSSEQTALKMGSSKISPTGASGRGMERRKRST